MKIAIIGAAKGQLPLCRKAKEMGLETHCFAYEKGAVCKDYVDYFYPISIYEKDEIVGECQRIGVNGVVSNASDITAEVVSYVAEKLNLVGISYEKLEMLRDKYYIRRITQEIDGLTSPRFYKYSGQDFGIYPCVVKPCEGAAKKGVSFATDSRSFKKALEYALKDNGSGVIVEEYIEGRELSVECISYNGVHYILQLTDKDSSLAPHFVELGHHQPAHITSELKNNIYKVIPNLLNVIGYANGASHIEIKYNKGVLYLIEINLRGGGDEISNRLVYLSSGIDYLKCMLEVALGIFKRPVKEKQSYCAGIYYLTEQTKYLLPFFEQSAGKDWLVEERIYSKELTQSYSNYERNGYLIYKSSHKITPLEYE